MSVAAATAAPSAHTQNPFMVGLGIAGGTAAGVVTTAVTQSASLEHYLTQGGPKLIKLGTIVGAATFAGAAAGAIAPAPLAFSIAGVGSIAPAVVLGMRGTTPAGRIAGAAFGLAAGVSLIGVPAIASHWIANK